MSDSLTKVIIVGGGLVGSLCACFLAKRGYQVDLYEYRKDIRIVNNLEGRSINLALSHRGRQALRYVGLEDEVLKYAIPMRGRFLHLVSGDVKSVPYDPLLNQCIYSVGRNSLNKLLLTELAKSPKVRLHFQWKLVNADLLEGEVTLLNVKTKEAIHARADLIIGADGAFSTVRRAMQQTSFFDYSQTYIEHGYLELKIPSANGQQMIPEHLHIWPRGEFMMIALPNYDHSWTVTLVMPFIKFESITSEKKLIEFFKETFPDSVSLIEEKNLIKDFFKHKPSPLLTIRCSQYHAGDNFLLIGDAAHAMVPFYGQGMNAGFQDCFIFNEILDYVNGHLGKALKMFSLSRKDDAHAICDLALYNYVEMRDLVNRRSFYLRKKLDEMLIKIFPKTWISLYHSISFDTMSYKQCVENRRWQNKIIVYGIVIIIGILLSSLCYLFYF